MRRQMSGSLASAPLIVVVIDGWSMLRAPGGDVTLLALGDTLARLVVEGAGVGLRFVLGTDRATSLSSTIAPSIATRFVLCPADSAEAASSGVRFSPSAVGIAGRAVLGSRPGVEVQFWHTTDLDVAAVASSLTSQHPAPRIDVLAERVSLATVRELVEGTMSTEAGGDWALAIGQESASLGAFRVSLRAGEPFLVCGPPRSGRTTALQTIEAVAAERVEELVVLHFSRGENTDAFVTNVFANCALGRVVLVVIDDADRIDDPGGHLARLLASDDARLRIVLAGRGDVLRSMYGHWSAAARRSRHGLALRPNPDVDGELWQTPLPRRLQVRGGPGRGVLVGDGICTVVQVGTRR